MSHKLKATGLAYQLVQAQAEDEGLWFQAETITEAYLQRALRRLHAAVEHDAGVLIDTPFRPRTVEEIVGPVKEEG